MINSKTFFRDDPARDQCDAICVHRAEAAKMLGISVSTLDRLTKAGELPCLKLPGRVLFRTEALRHWAKQRESLTARKPL
jgi:excisionase family DNA binding protein